MYITANVPMRETGTATVGMSVARGLRRNRNTTPTTRQMEITSVRSTSFTEARIVVVRSRTIVMSIPVGMEALTEGNSRRICSTVWMMLAPGWRKTVMVMPGLPLTKPAARTFCTESVTFATSDKCTAAPLLYPTIRGL